MNDLEIFKNALIKVSGSEFHYTQGFASDVYAVIFSHKFAKAFWGEEEVNVYFAKFIPAWQYHLQQMVLKENPLSYIEKFL